MTSAARNMDNSATKMSNSAESMEKSAALVLQCLGTVMKRHVSESVRIESCFKTMVSSQIQL